MQVFFVELAEKVEPKNYLNNEHAPRINSVSTATLGCPKYCKISILVFQYSKSSIQVCCTSIEQYS
jgi:hypothetical protein